MSDLLVTDALVATCDDERKLIDRGAIAIRDGRILDVGTTDALVRAHPDMPRMNAHGSMVCPGFVNAHAHAAMSVLRGTIEEWQGNAVYNYFVPISYATSDSERGVLALLACVEAIRSGSTALVDMARFMTGYSDAIASSGMRLWLDELCADIDTRRIRKGDFSVNAEFGDGCLERTQALIEKVEGRYGGRVRVQLAPHATDNCSPAMLRSLKELSQRHGLMRHIHLAQSGDEVKAVKAAHGLTPAAYLDREGWLDDGLVGAHWTHCTEADIDLLAERGVLMTHCPANSSRTGPHRVLIGRIRDAGVKFAFGTDDKTCDMFHALKIGQIIHRGGRGRPVEGGVEPRPQAMLDAITRDAAASVGAADEIGSIEAGKQADLTFIDLGMACLRPVINPVGNLVHYGHPGVVRSVMVGGDFLMRDREIVCLDEPALMKEAQAVTRHVWERMLADNPDIKGPAEGLHWYDV